MKDTEQKIRDMLRSHARTLLDRVNDPDADVRTMVEQAKQTAALMDAEMKQYDEAESLGNVFLQL